MTLSAHVPTGGVVIATEWFLVGTMVRMNLAVIQRLKSIFEEDADEFVPKRSFRACAAMMDRYMFQVRSWTPYIAMTNTNVNLAVAQGYTAERKQVLFAFRCSLRTVLTQILLCETYSTKPEVRSPRRTSHHQPAILKSNTFL